MIDHQAVAVDCARAVEGLNPLLARLRQHGERLAPLFDGARPTAAQVLRESRPIAFDILSDPTIVGAGFVVTPELLSDETFLLAWWQGTNKERLPTSAPEQTMDYTHQEWFRVPTQTGTAHVTGPYIDYFCTRDFALTSTVPVPLGQSLVGVIGADLLASTLERELEGLFRSAGATLVNHHDRAVVSGDVSIFAGDPVQRGRYRESQPCAGLPFTVLAGMTT